MASSGRGAGHRSAGCAGAGLTGIVSRAGVAVAARSTVHGVRSRAHAGGWVARAGRMASSGRGAGHGSAGCAGAGLAGIVSRAGVAVAARGTVHGVRSRTRTSARVARAERVTRGGRGAGHCGAGRARAGLTSIVHRAGVAVAAGAPIRRVRVRARAGARIAGTGCMTCGGRGTGHCRARRARAGLTSIVHRAGVAVAAGAPIRRVRVRARAGARIAGTGCMTCGGRGTGHCRARRARAGLTSIVHRAGVAVAAGAPIRRVRVRARAGARIAGTGCMTCGGRGTGHCRARRARAGLTGIIHSAGVAIAACRSVRGRRIRALATRRITRACHVTLVARHAAQWSACHAHPTLTRHCPGARVSAAARAIGRERVRAEPRALSARAGHVAVVTCGARHRIRPRARPALAGVHHLALVRPGRAARPVRGLRIGARAVAARRPGADLAGARC